MAKNIVVCCDGTANQFAIDKTNVVKTFYTLQVDPERQVTFYHPGLGTMEPPGALTGIDRWITKGLGQAIGYGLSSDICDAYVFLMNTFEEGDRIFLFGFSRGAYTVRAVTSMLHMYGLIRNGNESLVPYAIRMLTTVAKGAMSASTFDLAKQFRETFSAKMCKPYFVGVWDTVCSVGWIENQLKTPYISDNPDIEIGRHAISLDERRAFFRTNLWIPRPAPAASGPKDLKQVWFPGVHCDIGGGYPEAESGLSKIALEWMLGEARAKGLLLDDARVAEVLGRSGTNYVAPDPKAKMHESLTGWWRLAEFIPKKHYNWKKKKWEHHMNLFRSRTIPENSSIHESAYQRGESYTKRFPASAVKVSTTPFL